MKLLETHGLTAFYGDFQALFGIDLHVDEGETIAIVGANGAGKSTLMGAITGRRSAQREAITFDGKPIGGMKPAEIMARGIALVPEGRQLFPSLDVEENLLIGNYGRKVRGAWSLDAVYRLFPILKERRKQAATSLSGGQQQMVALGRALMSNPRLLLCDEISLGLAPAIIKDIYAALDAIRAEGASVMVVEQNIGQALAVSDRVYCLLEGRVTLTGRPEALSRDQISAAYFGGGR
ncbi:ABC transporter ATP-binding protein [Thetidibacter halocola]|uniref:ABC transporter ATP-binding protein n=1 Tax=Thetidibacter halocola TaxID=2827239 RepID=A0A8J7WFN3_9RHOB|nr:ABC transporter ATP-binding protein [Thetidibacter halocola]MBS0124463.1 ABC transporter ATP-binding protein [Thetidibacter halocola]